MQIATFIIVLIYLRRWNDLHIRPADLTITLYFGSQTSKNCKTIFSAALLLSYNALEMQTGLAPVLTLG